MLNITRSGQSLGEAAASLRDIPAWVIPYAAAAALTKTAKIAQKEMIDEMSKSFDRPVAYTLNSTFIVVATKDSLKARLGIKNVRPGNAVRAENFLFPEVAGGERRHTRFESALRHAGFLRSGEWALPAQSSSVLNSSGNVSGPKLLSILDQLGRPNSPFFVGSVGRKNTRGIWERGNFVGGRRGKNQKRSVRAIYVFTTNTPNYAQRLDFGGVAQVAVAKNFTTEFYRAVNTQLAKKARP